MDNPILHLHRACSKHSLQMMALLELVEHGEIPLLKLIDIMPDSSRNLAQKVRTVGDMSAKGLGEALIKTRYMDEQEAYSYGYTGQPNALYYRIIVSITDTGRERLAEFREVLGDL